MGRLCLSFKSKFWYALHAHGLTNSTEPLNVTVHLSDAIAAPVEGEVPSLLISAREGDEPDTGEGSSGLCTGLKSTEPKGAP